MTEVIVVPIPMVTIKVHNGGLGFPPRVHLNNQSTRNAKIA